MTRLSPLLLFAILVTGCSENGGVDADDDAVTDNNEMAVSTEAPAVTFKPGPESNRTSKLGPPVRVDYRIIGEPIVGQPVAIDLRLTSSLGTKTLDLNYRVNDSTALQFPDSQLQRVAIAPAPSESDLSLAAQQVTVIPMREGRLFLNVAVSMETDTGSWSSVTAVPIQVGKAPRELLENGTVTTDENGELIRSLPSSEN